MTYYSFYFKIMNLVQSLENLYFQSISYVLDFIYLYSMENQPSYFLEQIEYVSEAFYCVYISVMYTYFTLLIIHIMKSFRVVKSSDLDERLYKAICKQKLLKCMQMTVCFTSVLKVINFPLTFEDTNKGWFPSCQKLQKRISNRTIPEEVHF